MNRITHVSSTVAVLLTIVFVFFVATSTTTTTFAASQNANVSDVSDGVDVSDTVAFDDPTPTPTPTPALGGTLPPPLCKLISYTNAAYATQLAPINENDSLIGRFTFGAATEAGCLFDVTVDYVGGLLIDRATNAASADSIEDIGSIEVTVNITDTNTVAASATAACVRNGTKIRCIDTLAFRQTANIVLVVAEVSDSAFPAYVSVTNGSEQPIQWSFYGFASFAPIIQTESATSFDAASKSEMTNDSEANAASTSDISVPCQIVNIKSATTATSLAPMNGNRALLATFEVTGYGDDTVCTFDIVIRHDEQLGTMYWSVEQLGAPSDTADLTQFATRALVLQNDGGELTNVADGGSVGKVVCRRPSASYGVCRGRLQYETLTVYVTHRITTLSTYPSTVSIGEEASWTFGGYAQLMPITMR